MIRIASSLDAASRIAKPPTTSFVSTNGPSGDDNRALVRPDPRTQRRGKAPFRGHERAALLHPCRSSAFMRSMNSRDGGS